MPDGQRVARESSVRKRPEARDRPRFNNGNGARAARESRTPNPGGRMLGPVDLPVQVCAGPPLAVTLQVPIATSE